jgi:biopolymer transport protein ExbD
MEHDPWAEEAGATIRPRRNRQDDSEMDITPMIDITFLLLIFFLVASKMDTAAAITLPKARHGLPVAEKGAVVVTLTEGGPDGKALIYKGDTTDAGEMVRGADPVAQEDELIEFISEAMSGDEPKQYVLIKAEPGVKHREVSRVAKAVGKAEAVTQLYVAVLESQ